MTDIDLSWEYSTKYDFFISLSVLMNPERFNIRATWAAGVRSRIPATERQLLKTIHSHFSIPAAWCYQLAVPAASGEDLLTHIQAIPDEDILPALFMQTPQEKEIRELLLRIASEGIWQEEDLQKLRQRFQQNLILNKPIETKALASSFRCLPETGALYKKALASYYNTFFREEEARILPYLKNSLEQGKQIAKHQPLLTLIETLSHGLTLQAAPDFKHLVIAPSYWITPLVSYVHISAEKVILLHGCRPMHETVVPGELISPVLLQALKALADPTRLKIVKLLLRAPLSPKVIADQLRLRPPTVIHHLQILRSSGLVHVMLNEAEERLYSMESSALRGFVDDLGVFLFSDTQHE
jgi:DNA-binding transcriptional ArsR family regulator